MITRIISSLILLIFIYVLPAMAQVTIDSEVHNLLSQTAKKVSHRTLA